MTAWPTWSVPVAFGGGMTMVNGFFFFSSGSLSGLKKPLFSQRR